MQKTKPIRSQALRDLANGQPCTMQIPNVCGHDWSTTVLAHLPDESHGWSRKSDDHCAAFLDHDCHAFIDGRAPGWSDMSDGDRYFYMFRALKRTWRIAIDAGVICLKQ